MASHSSVLYRRQRPGLFWCAEKLDLATGGRVSSDAGL